MKADAQLKPGVTADLAWKALRNATGMRGRMKGGLASSTGQLDSFFGKRVPRCSPRR